MDLTHVLFGLAAVATGYIVSDTIREVREERTVTRFAEQLKSQVGVPVTWRMRPPAL
jgi:hypothetical protein